MTRPTTDLLQGGLRAPPTRYPRDDTAPARGMIIAVALSAPLWVPTYFGLAWLAGWARVVVGWRP